MVLSGVVAGELGSRDLRERISIRSRKETHSSNPLGKDLNVPSRIVVGTGHAGGCVHAERVVGDGLHDFRFNLNFCLLGVPLKVEIGGHHRGWQIWFRRLTRLVAFVMRAANGRVVKTIFISFFYLHHHHLPSPESTLLQPATCCEGYPARRMGTLL